MTDGTSELLDKWRALLAERQHPKFKLGEGYVGLKELQFLWFMMDKPTKEVAWELAPWWVRRSSNTFHDTRGPHGKWLCKSRIGKNGSFTNNAFSPLVVYRAWNTEISGSRTLDWSQPFSIRTARCELQNKLMQQKKAYARLETYLRNKKWSHALSQKHQVDVVDAHLAVTALVFLAKLLQEK